MLELEFTWLHWVLGVIFLVLVVVIGFTSKRKNGG